MARNQVRIPIIVDPTGAKRGIKETEGALGRLSHVGSKVGAALKANVALAAAGATAGLMALGKSAVSTASDIEEAENKNRVVFGRMVKTAEKFGETSAAAYGISKKSALEYVGTFGALIKTTGMAEKQNARMSVRLTQLGSDLASFYNTDVTDSLKAVQAGLVGQVRPLRRYGVLLSQTRIEATAMSMGLVKAAKDQDKIRAAHIKSELAHKAYNEAVKESGAKSDEARAAKARLIGAESALKKAMAGNVPELNDQQKMLARYNIILKDSEVAHGDFHNTANQLENKMRTLKAEWSDASARLGAILLPAVLLVVRGLVKFLQSLDAIAGAVKRVYQAIQPLVPAILALTAAFVAYKTAVSIGRTLDSLRMGMEALRVVYIAQTGVTNASTGAVLRHAAASKIAAAGSKALAIAQGALNLVMSMNPIALVIAALVGLGVAFVTLWKRSQKFRDIVTGVWEAVKTATIAAWRVVKNVVEGHINRMLKLWRLAKAPFVFIAKAIGGGIGDALSDAWNGILRGAAGFVNKLIDIINWPLGKLGIDKIGHVSWGTTSSTGRPKQTNLGQTGHLMHGGKVNTPIVVMGEEAPQHPEYVISTNPRDRQPNVGYWLEAGKELGILQFARGGRYSRKDLEALWARANPGLGNPRLMAAIALAESGGNPLAQGPVTSYGFRASGLWQIHPPQAGWQNPLANARMAGAKLRSQGLGAWEAYTNGSYKQYMSGGGVLGVLGDIWGGVKSLLGKLKLPSIPKGMGVFGGVMKAVGKKVLGAAKNLIFGGGDGGGGMVGNTLGIAHFLMRNFGLRMTSGYRSPSQNAAAGGVANSLHTHGSSSNPGAIDLIGSMGAMQSALSYARRRWHPKEAMIHDAGSGMHLHLGFFKKGGKRGTRNWYNSRMSRVGLRLARAEARHQPRKQIAALKYKRTTIKARIKLLERKMREKHAPKYKRQWREELTSLYGDLSSVNSEIRGVRDDLKPEPVEPEIFEADAAPDVQAAMVAAAQAGLTPGAEDDRAAASAMVRARERQYAAALATGDPDRIIEAANNLTSARESATQALQATLEETNRLLEQQLEYEKQRAEDMARLASTSQSQYATLAQALSDIANGLIGDRAGLGMQTPTFSMQY